MNQMINTKIYLFTFFFFCFCTSLSAQLGQTWSSYYEKGFAFNPALTAYWDNIEITASHRQEWSQFEGAPQNTSLGFQLPILSRDPISTSAAGVFIDRDEIGPLTSIGAKFSYSYRIVPKLFGNILDQLKLGIGFDVRRMRFDNENLLAFDGIEEDDRINFDSENQFAYSGSVGLFYISSDIKREYENHYFLVYLSTISLPALISNLLVKSLRVHM